MHLNRLFTIPVLIYLAVFVSITWNQGYFHNGPEIIFATPDADESRMISDFLYSGSDNLEEYALGLRGIIFPTYVSVHKLLGYTGYFVIQIILNILTLFFVFNSSKLITGSDRYALAVMIIMMSAPTFSLIVFLALSETLAFFLLSVSLYFALRYFYDTRKNYYLFISFLSSSLLICVKGIFLIAYFAFILLIIYDFLKSNRKLLKFQYFILGISPVILQMFLISVLTENGSAGSSGNFNFNNRLFPAIYNFENTGVFKFDSLAIAESQSNYPELSDKFQFMLENIPSTAIVSTMILGNNLIKGSNFTNFPPHIIKYHLIGNILHWISRIEILIFSTCHLLFLVLLFRLYRSKNNIPKLKLYIFLMGVIYSLILSSVLTFWQGDRLVIIGLPLWLVAYSGILFSYFQNKLNTAV